MSDVKAMSRAGRFNQIKMAIMLHWQRSNEHEITAYAIAKKIGMRPESPRFRFLLSSMVAENQLTMRIVKNDSNNKVAAFKAYYGLHENDAPKKREVVVKANGKQVGQLELF